MNFHDEFDRDSEETRISECISLTSDVDLDYRLCYSDYSNSDRSNIEVIEDLQFELQETVKSYKSLSASPVYFEQFAKLISKIETEWKSFEFEDRYSRRSLFAIYFGLRRSKNSGATQENIQKLKSDRIRIYRHIFHIVFGIRPKDPVKAIQVELDRLVALKRIFQKINDIDCYLISFGGIDSTTEKKLRSAKQDLLNKLYDAKSNFTYLISWDKNVVDGEEKQLFQDNFVFSELFRILDEYVKINTYRDFVGFYLDSVIRSKPCLRTVKHPKQSSYKDVNRFQVGLYRLMLPDL